MHINPVGEKELAPLQFQSSSHVPKHVRNAPKRSTLKPYLSSSSFASETISFKSNMLSGSTKILDKSKIADMQKSTEPGSKRPANCLKRPTGKPKRQSLKSRENHWV